jgi:hypothetical protein
VNVKAEAVLDHAAWNIGDSVCRHRVSSRSPGSPPASFPCGRLLAQTGDPAGGERRPALHADRVGSPLSPPFACKPKQAAGAVGLEVPDGWLAASGGPSVPTVGDRVFVVYASFGSAAESHVIGVASSAARAVELAERYAEEDGYAWRGPDWLKWGSARRVRPAVDGRGTAVEIWLVQVGLDELTRFVLEPEPLLEEHD